MYVKNTEVVGTKSYDISMDSFAQMYYLTVHRFGRVTMEKILLLMDYVTKVAFLSLSYGCKFNKSFRIVTTRTTYIQLQYAFDLIVKYNVIIHVYVLISSNYKC